MAEGSTTKVIRIVIDARGARSGGDEATRALAAVERSTNSMGSAMDRLERALGGIGGALRALSAGMVGLEFLRAADSVTRFGNSLRVAGIQGEALAGVQQRLFDMAARNGVEVEALGQMYGRVAMTSRELGASQADMLKFVGGVTDALKVQGGSAEQASGALLQLSQAMGAGVVRAEEFNSILEGALPIAQAAARGIDGMGGSVAKLRAEIVAGNVTSRAFFDGLLKGFDQTKVQADSATRTMGSALAGVKTRWTELSGAMDQMSNASPTIIGVLDAIAGSLGKITAAARESRGSLLSFMGSVISPDFGPQKQALELQILQKEAKESRDRLDKITGTGLLANASRNREQTFLDARLGRISEIERAIQVTNVGGKSLPALADDPDNIGLVIKRPPASPLKPKGDGGDGNRLAEALQDAQRELDQARAFAEVANQGADAIAKMEVHFKALKTSQDVFSKTANDNSGAAKALADSLEKAGLETLKLKNLGDFRGGTASLRDQNELLEAELRLANALPEVRAKELAVLKTMQEVREKGLADNKQDIADRIAVVETNERLKLQGEELKRSNELWTAPLKSALENIQSSTADWIDKMLEGLQQGKAAVIDFGQIGISIVRRMVSEFASLAIMRPMMGSLVGGLASIGLVSPATASSLGYGQSISGPAVAGGGGGLGSLFGGGSSFFSQPIASLFPSSTPSGGFASVGDLLASGQTGASASASGIGGLGGISIGQGLGALAGAGMGIYNLATANGNTGKTIGGIGSIIGAGVSLIPGIGQIAGPIISILSSIVPSLFGEGDTRTHSSTNANLRYGSGGWYTTGGAYGSGANSGQSESALRGTTAGIDSVFDLMGGVKDASKVWGLNLSSWTAQGKDWSYTSNATHLVDPNGNREAWRMNMSDMLDTGSAQVAIRSILSGAVGEITDTMKGALEHMRAASMGIKETAESIVFVDEVYERLGKGALTVRAQFRELEKQFGDMTDTAKKLGLSLEPVIAEQKKQTERLGQDYIDNLINPIAAQLRAWEDEKQSILANTAYIAEHTDVVVDMARVNEALLRKEAALKNELYGGAVSQLEDAIARLMPGGNLSNLDPSGTFAGLKASYQSTYAQAAAGDAAAIGRFGAESTAYAEYARSYFAGSAEYEAIRQQIVEALRTVQVEVTGGAANGSGGTNMAAEMQQLKQLVQTVVANDQAKSQESAELLAVMTRMTNLLSRYVTNGVRG
ncbi:tape measure protein [uncultured Reyranella sp.]|uniref:tape measure protein n=1 Tax=uncultured Reyranella sp. TaxID=735512 RepID=UPI0025F8DF90|nr:tape measure protein [uncultured Reyranella sp.]